MQATERAALAPPAGARAEAPSEVTCTHCGLPVPSGLVEPGAPHQFCCTGCRAAYEILHEHGLEQYYRLGAPRGASVSPTGRALRGVRPRGIPEIICPAAAGRAGRRSTSTSRAYTARRACGSWSACRSSLPGVARAELEIRRSLAPRGVGSGHRTALAGGPHARLAGLPAPPVPRRAARGHTAARGPRHARAHRRCGRHRRQHHARCARALRGLGREDGAPMAAVLPLVEPAARHASPVLARPDLLFRRVVGAPHAHAPHGRTRGPWPCRGLSRKARSTRSATADRSTSTAWRC